MFNHKGSTLIEALFAFQIFISVIIMFITLFSQINLQKSKLSHHYEMILEEEGDLIYQEDFQELIEMVLHSSKS